MLCEYENDVTSEPNACERDVLSEVVVNESISQESLVTTKENLRAHQPTEYELDTFSVRLYEDKIKLASKIGRPVLDPISRWDFEVEDLPYAPIVKIIDFYEFDGTLFKSPVLNDELFRRSSIHMIETGAGLKDIDWWNFHEAWSCYTNESVRENKKWKDSWSLPIRELMKSSKQSDTTVCVLICSFRDAEMYNDLREVLASEDIAADAIITRPKHIPAADFKKIVVLDLLHYYSMCQEVNIYDWDKEFLISMDQLFLKWSTDEDSIIEGTTVVTPRLYSHLDPLVERQLVENLIDEHNRRLVEFQDQNLDCLTIRQSLLGTVYFLTQTARIEVLEHCIEKQKGFLPDETDSLVFECEEIYISLNNAQSAIKALGGIGAQIRFGVSHYGSFADQFYALKLLGDKELPSLTKSPILLIARHPDAIVKPLDCDKITNWQVMDDLLLVNTVVGNKGYLKVKKM
ncbi:BA75_00258T0 [Komagataella pastoris]|uniref:BA75_00258T0 n=1 Tax=Komagataella pastoris TaxID=4922 RepID=A0A1B2J528_PICPA|nr:BA75_00258T0 [Komagataella pastoris]